MLKESLLLSLITASTALAANNELPFTITAPQTSAPLQILDFVTYGSMSISARVCNPNTCSFKVMANLFWQTKAHPDAASITVGKDLGHACTFSFDNDPGIIIMQVKLQKVNCSGDWQINNLQSNPITILGQ